MDTSENPIKITSDIILTIFAVSIYIIGVYLHIKIMFISKHDKDLTWRLDITNSPLLMFHYSHKIFMIGITYLIEELYVYTGVWFCYSSKVVTHYLGLYMSGHSLIVAIMKYVWNVQWRKVRSIGNEKIKTFFFFVNFLHPMCTISFWLITRPDFFVAWDAFSQIDRCLGDPKGNWDPESNRTQTKLHNLCNFKPPNDKHHFEYFIYICRTGCCWLQIVVHYLIIWNVFEIIFYCSTFWFMRR